MSLRAMKRVHEPVVVGLAGMVQEQPATLLAGMDQAEIYICQECAKVKICFKANIWTVLVKYVKSMNEKNDEICRKYA